MAGLACVEGYIGLPVHGEGHRPFQDIDDFIPRMIMPDARVIRGYFGEQHDNLFTCCSGQGCLEKRCDPALLLHAHSSSGVNAGRGISPAYYRYLLPLARQRGIWRRETARFYPLGPMLGKGP
jgi:hypothetical protein